MTHSRHGRGLLPGWCSLTRGACLVGWLSQYVTWQVIRSQPTFASELRDIDFFDELQVGDGKAGRTC